MKETNNKVITTTITDEKNPSNQNLNFDNQSHETNLNGPTNKPKVQFKIKMIGIMTDINFYIPDVEGDTTGMAFRMAYHAARNAKNNNELCAYVGSMLCSVVPEFKNSVLTSLNEICIRPRFVCLPSQAEKNRIVESGLPQLDWLSILVIFGYCLLLLFKLDIHLSIGYDKYISNRIRGLQAEVRWDPSKTFDIPFDSTKANALTTMLGSRDLRKTVITFLMDNSNYPDLQISKVCNYLSNILSCLSLD